jgi:DNA-binding MurR/RpiR family transcriptional regulator
MGFADLSIADIAAEYDLPIETVFRLCERLGVAYKNQQTNLALEDAKAVISQILSQRSESAKRDSPSPGNK